MKSQKGFTLIELMVVIVIIGILSALAVPKMFGVSAKAKMAEAPGVIANWETLQASYVQEKSAIGNFDEIGFKKPPSKWFDYDIPTSPDEFVATVSNPIGDCGGGEKFTSTFSLTAAPAHLASTTACGAYVPNFLP